MSAGAEPAGGLLRSTAAMAAGTVVSRVTGFLRAAVLAAVIGTRLVSDVFTIANTVPNIIYILLAGGVLNSVLVPQVVRAMKSDSDGGAAYAQRMLGLSVVALAVITVLATLAAPLIIGAYLPGDYSSVDVARTVSLAYWCLPQIFFYGLFTVTGQLLNARGRFGPMMWAPVLNNVVAIATTLALAALAGTLNPVDTAAITPTAVLLLGGGATLGVAAQAVVILPVLRRTGLPMRLRFDWRGSGLGRAGRAAVWMVLFVLVNQVAYLVVTRIVAAAGVSAAAESLGYGAGPAAYNNAYLIFVLPHSILTVSVVTALLPGLAGLAVDGALGQVAEKIAATLRTLGVLLVPVAAAMVALGPSITTVAFGYGEATMSDTFYMGVILAAFAVGLVPFSSHYTVLRGFYALEDTRTPFLLQTLVAAVNVVLALACMALPASSRAVGVALAWSLAYAVGFAVSGRVLAARLGGLGVGRLLGVYTRAAVAAMIGALPALVVLVGASLLGMGPYLGRLAGLLVGGPLLVVCYIALARAMRMHEVLEALALLRERLPARLRPLLR